MLPLSLLVRWGILLGAIYLLLILPWPTLDAGYARLFRSVGNGCFDHDFSGWNAHFETVPSDEHHILSTRARIIDRAHPAPGGGVPALYLELDPRGIAWVPTAWLVALVLSTPIALGRRWRALALGLLLLHAYIYLGVGLSLLDAGAQLAGVPPEAGWRMVLGALSETTLGQLGPSFLVPVVIWVLVAIRREDVQRWSGSAAPRA